MIDFEQLKKALYCRKMIPENPDIQDCENCQYYLDDELQDCDDIQIYSDAYDVITMMINTDS